MPAPSEPTDIHLTPNAVGVLRAWGSRYQSERVPGRVGLDVVGVEIGYGRGNLRHAGKALADRLKAGRFPAEVWERLAFLVWDTSDSAWADLRLALDSHTWSRTTRAVDGYREQRSFAGGEVPATIRVGRPVRSTVGAASRQPS